MGDRTNAEIELCGELTSEENFETLVYLLSDEGLGEEFCGGTFTGDQIRTALLDAARDGRRAVFRGDEINYGEFVRLETFCREAGIAYVRRSGTGCLYGPEAVSWSPGMAVPAKTLLSADGEPLLPRSALGAIERMPPEEAMAALARTLAELDRACGKGLPSSLVIGKELAAVLERTDR